MTNSSKVFCIGCNKTGTTSLKAAMQDMGFVFGDQNVAARMAPEIWPSRDFGRLVEYCSTAQAFQDAPFSFPFTYQAMDIAFPASSFILTVRSSPDEWYRSLTQAHTKLYGQGTVPTKQDLESADNWLYKGRPWEMNRLLFDSPEDDPYQRDALVAFYANHVYSVKQYFRHRPHDLLVLDVAEPDAYQRLCRFLQKPIVTKQFPHLNRS